MRAFVDSAIVCFEFTSGVYGIFAPASNRSDYDDMADIVECALAGELDASAWFTWADDADTAVDVEVRPSGAVAFTIDSAVALLSVTIAGDTAIGAFRQAATLVRRAEKQRPLLVDPDDV